ncbi:hypothetical protein BJ508DRAFT_410299 [Ascobolus immersus RN42]|uniref:Nucleoside transporter family n=1 Tax=Ascobolus immersus RN42 TaxID=1160509 RepID=A0A3N4J0U2_ASCIM|nr:hypothetical protein BJ508DRAFT_410299 [Ascobolus immersus RN42]
MDRIRQWLNSKTRDEVQYEPVPDSRPQSRSGHAASRKRSNFEYLVFLTLGCAMLWAWSMFMASTMYFRARFADNRWIFTNYNASILFVACSTNFSTVMYLSSTAGQRNANYPRRIKSALIINMFVFTILAFSTIVWTKCSAEAYFVLVLSLVFTTNLATGLIQNGVFALVSGYEPICTQGVMTGQGLAGVLPGLAQIISVLSTLQKEPNDQPDPPSGTPAGSAFFSFFTATIVSGVTLLLFQSLLARTPAAKPTRRDSTASEPEKASVPMLDLLLKLRYQAFTITFNFALTMIFPIFTIIITSSHPKPLPPLLLPPVFVPLSFIIWNLGDFLGRLICAWPIFHVTNPKLQTIFAMARLAFIPLYYQCNLYGMGAKFGGDAFYWLVQIAFGMTNGWVGSNVMMAAPAYAGEEMREAAGGFLGACIMGGLTLGSFLGFFVTP